MREGHLFTEPYRGIPVSIFWIRPDYPHMLIYGYQIENNELEIYGTGFPTSGTACRTAGQIIDTMYPYLLSNVEKKKR